jgi:hypothetical protein
MNLEPIPTGANAFWFGSGIHEALAVSAASMWSLAVARDQWTEYCKLAATYDQNDNLVSGFVVPVEGEHSKELGMEMLTYFVGSWVPRNDHMKIVHVERAQIMPLFTLDKQVGQYPEGTQVFYGYKLDGLVQDEHERFWIREYKTSAQIGGSYDYLLNDGQAGRYWWAEQIRLGVPIEGVDYIILKKKAIQHLRLLKNGAFSVAKDQDTNYATAMSDIKAANQDPAQYQEFLDMLREKPDNFVLRHTVRRNLDELANIEKSLKAEVMLMLGDPLIYRNDSAWNCNNCSFFDPCLQRWENSDYMTTLRLRYREREEPYQRILGELQETK